MADLVDHGLVDVALALLRADPGLTVYPSPDGVVPATPATPYVRIYGSVERLPGAHNALDGVSRWATVRWWCHCVGATQSAALAVAVRVRAALLDQRPTVVGRSCGLIRQEAQPPPTRDESTGVSVYDVVAVYRMDSPS